MRHQITVHRNGRRYQEIEGDARILDGLVDWDPTA
ncbi:hypothetical protein BJ986_001971 [Phycicoccus badiiscoriae]|uniref:Uncharacterized protein n=1 Tax=Pedococcus badiiscoriae TaxID=642776 RepID=A0A852WL44_9MICO|nr:hypothetical protein [Pedococcus badiiscoriae]